MQRIICWIALRCFLSLDSYLARFVRGCVGSSLVVGFLLGIEIIVFGQKSGDIFLPEPAVAASGNAVRFYDALIAPAAGGIYMNVQETGDILDG